MNWDKAKNLTILFLLMVNVFLGALIYSAGRKYTLTAAQEDAVTKYLALNSVSLYTTIPRDFRPMAPVRIRPVVYSANELVPAFFGSRDNITPDFDNGRPLYTRGEESLVIDGDYFVYENARSDPEFVLSRTNAIEVCNKFMSRNEKVFGKYSRDHIKETKDGYLISYSGKFRQYLITSNSMVFHVTENGIAQITGAYSNPLGLSGEPREIISPDEALYLFVRHMNYIYGDQEILLDGIDLVYYLAEVTTDSSIPLYATPYYRFYVFEGDSVVMVNAYTGDTGAVVN